MTDLETDKRICAVLALAWIVFLAIALASCGPTPTVTKTETVTVKVPVAVQPIRGDQVPAMPAPLPKRSGNLSADADTLLAKVCEWVGYGFQSDPLLRISAGEPPRMDAVYPECSAKPAPSTR